MQGQTVKQLDAACRGLGLQGLLGWEGPGDPPNFSCFPAPRSRFLQGGVTGRDWGWFKEHLMTQKFLPPSSATPFTQPTPPPAPHSW